MVDKKFWLKVNKTKTCWLWTGSHNGQQYGQLSRRRYLNRPILAHRYSWFLRFGEWPPQFLCHKCDNPRCVKPSHLFLGTAQDNMDDLLSKGGGNHGSRHGLSKLQEKEVIAIRSAYALGTSINTLAKKHVVCRSNIEHIIHRRRWRHV